MMKLRFEALLSQEGWLQPAYVDLDETGAIAAISTEVEDEDEYSSIKGHALPGFQNAHSHAFQYAMAGLAEIHQSDAMADDFWSWREAMYQIALRISPEQLEAVATMLYAEMLRHGYTAVAEFHYVHHDPTGKPYENLSEMGQRLVAAASKTGIRLTLLPVFYEKGGFGKPSNEGQRRFISANVDGYSRLLEASASSVKAYEHASLGLSIHSIRAVSQGSMVEAINRADADFPIHIHIAEQLKEVADCFEFYGKRPVEWLYEQLSPDENYHLVHATHLTTAETRAIAESGAHVVLCPSTEGNLGDGLFPFADYQSMGGRWSIGTDSHVSLDPKEELRLLDYGQRLVSHRRNTFVKLGKGDSAMNAYAEALESGKRAMGKGRPELSVGNPLDVVVLDASYPLYACSSLDSLMATMLYSGDASSILGTMVAGEWLVEHGRHRHQAYISEDFLKAMKELDIR